MEKLEILSDLKMVQLLITFNVDARDPVGSKYVVKHKSAKLSYCML